MILTHDDPMGVLAYPTTIGGGIVWVSIGADFGDCDIRLAFLRQKPGTPAPVWEVVTLPVRSAAGNIEYKVDTDGTVYHRVSAEISNISHEWTRDFGEKDDGGKPILRPSKFGESPYCGIKVAVQIIPDAGV